MARICVSNGQYNCADMCVPKCNLGTRINNAPPRSRDYSAIRNSRTSILATGPEHVKSIAMRPTSEAPANSPPACVDEEVDSSAIPVSPVFGILFALSFAHLVNDTLQSLIPAIYPILKTE